MPSDRHMTFSEDIRRSFHKARIAVAVVSGAASGDVFWLIAARHFKRRGRHVTVDAPVQSDSPKGLSN